VEEERREILFSRPFDRLQTGARDDEDDEEPDPCEFEFEFELHASARVAPMTDAAISPVKAVPSTRVRRLLGLITGFSLMLSFIRSRCGISVPYMDLTVGAMGYFGYCRSSI
jgi:hypothetical protein